MFYFLLLCLAKLIFGQSGYVYQPEIGLGNVGIQQSPGLGQYFSTNVRQQEENIGFTNNGLSNGYMNIQNGYQIGGNIPQPFQKLTPQQPIQISNNPNLMTTNSGQSISNVYTNQIRIPPAVVENVNGYPTSAIVRQQFQPQTIGNPNLSTGNTGIGSTNGGQLQQTPIITKDFYIHSAPDEPEEEEVNKIINVGQPRKHYRVIFIKAPQQSHKSAHVTLAQAPSEERTLIYVLSKKPENANIQADLKESVRVQNKPEVFFIKYKTQEEAHHAQKQIQAQYDSLGGIGHISNEGVSPVTSVIGSLDKLQQGYPLNIRPISPTIGTNTGYPIPPPSIVGNMSYLPPN